MRDGTNKMDDKIEEALKHALQLKRRASAKPVVSLLKGPAGFFSNQNRTPTAVQSTGQALDYVLAWLQMPARWTCCRCTAA